MVKIVAHGKYYRNAKCKRCECSFGYSVKDLQPLSLTSDKYYVNCPECEERHIDTDNLMDKRYPVDEEDK